MKLLIYLFLAILPIALSAQKKCDHKNVVGHAYFTNPPYYESVCADCGNVLYRSRKSFEQIAGYTPIGLPNNLQQGRHTHTKHQPYLSKRYSDPLNHKDTTSIKHNVIDYGIIHDSCIICHKWYETRVNIDTFSTLKKAKYSNIKYPKH